jgi:hypothetical protein
MALPDFAVGDCMVNCDCADFASLDVFCPICQGDTCRRQFSLFKLLRFCPTAHRQGSGGPCQVLAVVCNLDASSL